MPEHTPETRIEAIAAPLPIANLDTDQIMPKQFLRGIDKQGLAQGLLYDLRFDAQGRPRPDCVLNQPGYADAGILIGGANFGCGSSREHAVWGLLQYGIRAVIAPSYGEIFYSNAMNNRLVPVVLPEAEVEALMRLAARPGQRLRIDIAAQCVEAAGVTYPFSMSAQHHRMLMLGTDMIGMTLSELARIQAFERAHLARSPWVARSAEPAGSVPLPHGQA